jgi:hypothetical protein
MVEWKMYLPKRRKHTEEQVTVTASRSLILNRPATERIKALKAKHVHLLHRGDGAIAIKPLLDKEPSSLKLHFAPMGNVVTISASGLLQEMRYHKKQPKRRLNLFWKEKQNQFEFSLPKDKLHGRKRRGKRSK